MLDNHPTAMDALFADFSLLAGEALRDKSFDPARIESLMVLFEQEAERSWYQAEADGDKEALDSDAAMKEAEAYLVSLMDASEAELLAFGKTAAKNTESEMQSLIGEAKLVNKVGKLMSKAADVYSNNYIDAALVSATASMKRAWSGFSGSSSRSKVFPS